MRCRAIDAHPQCIHNLARNMFLAALFGELFVSRVARAIAAQVAGYSIVLRETRSVSCRIMEFSNAAH
jgi:hypothetical protein